MTPSRRSVITGMGGAATAALAGCPSLSSDGGDGSTGNGQQTDGGIPSDPVDVGLQTALEGAASLFGNPTRDGAQLAVDRINEAGGIAGQREVNLDVVNEGNYVENYERFVDEGKEVTLGPVSSGGHVALAPVVEEVGVVNIATGGGSAEVFLDAVPDPTYAFHTSNVTLQQDVTAALASVEKLGDVETIGGVYPNYTGGQTAHEGFSTTMDNLTGAEVAYAGFPDFGASDYATHITEINSAQPDVTYSNLYGTDLTNFLNQAISRDMFENTTFVSYTVGNQLNELPQSIVEEADIIAGSREFYWRYPPASRYQPMRELLADFRERHDRAFPEWSWAEGYMAVTAWATAVEKAINMSGEWPSQEQLAGALEGHGYYMPDGYHVLSDDHTGRSNEYYGELAIEDGNTILDNLAVFPPNETAPPIGIESIQGWIDTWE